MKIIDPNYEPEPQTFTQFPDGTYKAKGFEWFTTSNNRPSLKAQKDGRMVGRLKWLLEDGTQGPPQSLDLTEMALLGNVYGMKKNPPQVSNAGAVATYMEELQKAASSKVVDAVVSKGWATIKQMIVPTGYFRFYLSRVSDLRDGEYGKFFFVDFTITAGEGGSATPYKGATFTEIYNYAVVNKNGTPQWELTDKGQPNAAAARLSTLIRLTAPEYASQDIAPADPNNILPEWIDEALSVRKILKGSRAEITNKDGKKRIGLVQQTLEPAYEDQKQTDLVESTGLEISSNGNSSASTPKDILVNMMNDIMGVPAVVADQLTAAGKKFAGQYFKPLKDSGKLVNTTFMLLTDHEVYEIVKLVYQGNEEWGVKENFLYEEDFNRVNEMVNGIVKDKENQDVPWVEEVVEEENPFS